MSKTTAAAVDVELSSIKPNSKPEPGSSSGSGCSQHCTLTDSVTVVSSGGSDEEEEEQEQDGEEEEGDGEGVGFWGRNVSVVVSDTVARDHLALERTYLSYHRTSLVLAVLATTISQLFILTHAPTPSPTFGFYILGKPLAVTICAFALVGAVVGGARWWRLQRALLSGRAVSGGWEVVVVGGGGALVVVGLFVIVVALDFVKEVGVV